jgi:hypothetical protein
MLMKSYVISGIPSLALTLAMGLLSLQRTPMVHAQSASAPTTVRGKIVSLKGSELVVASPSGDVKLTLSDKTRIRAEVAIKFSEINPGMYLGTTATKQADGNFLASEVHVFSEDQRGTSEGHRPLSSNPQSGATMTNANVERVEDLTVQDIKGRVMILRYKGGEVRVLVPPDIPVVQRMLADRGALNSGADISAQALRGADGSLAASQITVRAAGR